jgi:hypothetical protein
VKRLPKFLAAISIAVTWATAQVRMEKSIDSEKIGRVCGQLLHVDRRIAGLGPGVGRVDTTVVPKTVVKLYSRDSSCCEGVNFVGQTETSSDGNFKFGSVKPGHYWLETTVAGREYKVPFRLERPNEARASCADQLFEVDDSGNFEIVHVVRGEL